MAKDQRTANRPQDGNSDGTPNVDVGAYELAALGTIEGRIASDLASDGVYVARSQSFDTDPGWTSYQADQGGNDFGFSETGFTSHQQHGWDLPVEGSSGAAEIGGRFARSGTNSHYADTDLVDVLDFDHPFSARGRLDVQSISNPDFVMTLGYFDPQDVQHDSANLLDGDLNAARIVIVENQDSDNFPDNDTLAVALEGPGFITPFVPRC